MALTKIRGEQIQIDQIGDRHIDPNDRINYVHLNLENSLIATDLNTNESVHQAVLNSKLIALWDRVDAILTTQAVGSSIDVTSAIAAAAAVDIPQSSINEEGVLLTGTGANGVGDENYRVQIRRTDSGDPVSDGLSSAGAVYGELHHDGSNYTLHFKKSDGTDFTFQALPEITDFKAVAASTLAGQYFTLNDGGDVSFYVWFNAGSSVDPAPGGTGIEVNLADQGSGAAVTAQDVALRVYNAIDARPEFETSLNGDTVRVTNASNGSATDATAGTSGFTVTKIQDGTAAGQEIDFMFVEIYTYQSAPAKSFITGMGFADIVGVAGTHQHDDRYFTQTELIAGQLDGRYYTETELNNGTLDSRYYTETELSPTAPLGDNELDARYRTETELSGTGGAALIGTADGGTVQSTIGDIESSIQDIIDGTTNITHSLDGAYDDGSVVAVDATDVDWQLADTKTFAVSDGTSNYLSVSRDAGSNNTVAINTEVVDVDASAGMTMTATESNLTLETATSGNVSLTSAGTLTSSSVGNTALSSDAEFTLKDQHLSTGIPVSEAGETGLVGYTATSIVGALNEALTTASSSATIGAAEDGDYTDGLFVDFTDDTQTGTAVDRFNEVLKSLAPKPAPTLADIGIDNGGVTGKLSFGTSNTIAGYTNHPSLDVGSTYTKSGDTMGIFDNVGTLSGNLADNVPAGGASNRPYPARAFANGDSGNLVLRINGVDVHTVDLGSFGSGSSVNANGSGFSLSAATPVEFDNGDDFEVFKYRTGTWVVNVDDCDLGYNTIQVVHDGNTTNTLNFVIDDASAATAYSGEALSAPSMTGTNQISGVSYHTGGTVEYSVTADNVYRNTYSSSANAVNFSATNASISDEALPVPTTEADPLSITGKVATISSGSRLLDGSVSVSVQVARTLQSTSASSGASVSGILLDATSANSTATAEYFNDERYRVAASLDETTTGVYNPSGASPSEWDSSQSLVGGDAGHNTGLLVYNGRLMYPTQGLNGGNFSTISNGPAGNVDYSGATGNRTYYRFFHTSSPRSNFRLNVTATGTSFVDVATGPSGNNLTMEVLAPNTTTDGSTVEWKDGTVPYTDDNSIGCYSGTYGNSIPTSWGMTLGTKNTSTSGNVIVIRITAPATWTGSVDAISLTWL